MSFDGKVVLITGAASGMGRLAAHRMAEIGARVAALDVNEAGLDETVSQSRHGERIRAQRLDVTDTAAVEAATKDVESRLGPIERVYNAAAIMPTRLLAKQDTAEIHRIMDVNYGGVVNVTKAVLPGMLERRRGDLINFASIAGWTPSMHFGAYNASKFAVVAFTEVQFHEQRRSGVRIACVCPPPVDTPLLAQATSRPKVLEQMGRPIRPDRVLDAIDRHLVRGRLWVFPDARTRLTWRMRRWVPDLLWAGVHRIEGR
jgi:NAD(P)-dependent dehydrogenase (short-subunit alcohol dehydrogenase family)